MSATTIFVSGFGATVTSDEIKAALGVHGEIVSRVSIRKKKTAFAFVEYADEASAGKAVAAGLTLGEDACVIELQKDKPPRREGEEKTGRTARSKKNRNSTDEKGERRPRERKGKPNRKNTIYVRGITIAKTDEELASVTASLTSQFESHGTIAKVDYSGRGYGFVTFETAESMQAAVEAGAVTTSEGAELEVEESTGVSRPRESQTGPKTTIYVKNLPDIDDSEIAALFASYGTVTRIANLSTARGFAFVSFETVEEMQNALAAESLVVGENALEIEEQKRPPRAA